MKSIYEQNMVKLLKNKYKNKNFFKIQEKKIFVVFEKYLWYEESNVREKVGFGNRMKSVGNRNIWLNIKGI